MTAVEITAPTPSTVRQGAKNALRDLMHLYKTKRASDQNIAEWYVSQVSDEELRRLASLYAASLVWELRRETQRAAELRAIERSHDCADSTTAWLKKKYNVSTDEELNAVIQQIKVEFFTEEDGKRDASRDALAKLVIDQLRADPVAYYRKCYEDERGSEYRRKFDFYRKSDGKVNFRRSYVRWIIDRFKVVPDFDKWLAWAHKQINASDLEEKTTKEYFREDWHPSGVQARITERHEAEVQQLIDAWKDELRLEVTRELLGSEFALGDGVRVSWGNATAEQHTKRIDMLTKNAVGNAETASRHQAALDMILAAGVKCLNDLQPTTKSSTISIWRNGKPTV